MIRIRIVALLVAIVAGLGCTTGQSKATTSPETANARIEYTSFHSESLGADVRCAISLPASYEREPKRRFPVVIFLHGLFNDERDWEKRGIAAKLDALRTEGKVGEYIVAMPYGANSFYLNGKDGTKYEDAIVKDFIPYVDATYRTVGTAKGRAIQGISMGGFGALVIAFKHPELFAAVITHCAAIFERLPDPPASSSDARGTFRYQIASKIFGAPADATFFKENNPLDLARANASRLKNLKIYFDVGEQDRYGFAAGNTQLDTVLNAASIKHEFHMAPGDHGWSFMLSRCEPAFEFCWSVLKP